MTAKLFDHFCMALVGPAQGKPCGISDYLLKLLPALKKITITEYLTYDEALAESNPHRINAILVHYERSLLSKPNSMLLEFGKKFSNIFLVPHEVYEEDPFAFPFSKVVAPWGLLWLKQGMYRWRHRNFYAEIALQRQGYYAQNVFPLNCQAKEILSRRCKNLRKIIPLAATSDSIKIDSTKLKSLFFPNHNTLFVVGIFGFLTAANDYRCVMEAMSGNSKMVLLILGGSRTEVDFSDAIKTLADKLGLKEKIVITGYISESELNAHLAVPDLFVFPAIFKSSSSSVLRLLGFNKPILAAELPLTRELVEEGAPLTLFQGTSGLRDLLSHAVEKTLPINYNKYPHTYEIIAKAYVDSIKHLCSQ